MFDEFFDLNKIKEEQNTASFEINKISKKDIAVIGVYGKFPMAENINEFWKNIRNGKDCIREFPQQRMKDVEHLLPNSYMPADPPQICQAGYLDEIDKFDNAYFNISPNEAKLMDPNQRLFLQAAWGVIEDAGYEGKKIKGSKTGVYVGHSSDLKFEYHMMVNTTNPSLYEQISLAGNVKSIIASRISYLLDLKGPSIVVDSACSSGLVAVHLACNGIINGECDMAIAGGVKINLLPIQKGLDDEIGIRSSGDRARTFDDSSDGTGSGEGVAAILLKSLSKAASDGDNIYAVIKGSAINQDGNSIGLTAPNSAAQEEVILEAWKNARVNPEKISYIETHGTATKLGDPIEINGIERAFRKYTDKRNFCAVGSVKTNIGHLDHISGIAGLIKLVLALKHKEIPASIHFKRPNRNINFIDSPVYINDRSVKWEKGDMPLIGGISSFGLAGTNCHMIVEEYKTRKNNEEEKLPVEHRMLTLSAQSMNQLLELVHNYIEYLDNCNGVALADICYTSNIGRIHHNHRIAVIAYDKNELKKKLEEFYIRKENCDGVYYGKDKISGYDEKINRIIFSKDTFNQSDLEEICILYTNGAELDLELLYKGQKRQKTNLPLYPFKSSRCWVEPAGSTKQYEHSLVQKHVVNTIDQDIYSTSFSVDTHWALAEHKVAGNYVLPGTAYLEMITYIFSKNNLFQFIEMENIMFLSPLVVDEKETKEVQIIVKKQNDSYGITIASRLQEGCGWNVHVEGKVKNSKVKDIPVYDIDFIMQDANMKEIIEDLSKKSVIDIGSRWTNIGKRLFGGDNREYLAYFEVTDAQESELKDYRLHISLMDRSINAVNDMIGEDSYLPLSYTKLTVYGSTPKKMYSYIRRVDSGKTDSETARFDVVLMDVNGKAFVEIEDYVVKRIKEKEFNSRHVGKYKSLFHYVGWIPVRAASEERDLSNADILVFKSDTEICNDFIHMLRGEGCNVIEVELGRETIKSGSNRYIIKNDQQGCQFLIDEVLGKNLTHILHMSTLENNIEIKGTDELEQQLEKGMYSLFYLAKALNIGKSHMPIELVLISNYANEVTGSEEIINPHNASLFGLGKVVGQENSNLKCRCIDIDESISAKNLLNEIKSGTESYQCAYRNGIRYVDEFRKYNITDEIVMQADLRGQGVYVITGGSGGLGLEMGKYLCSKSKVKIALVSRSEMPARKKWNDVLEKDSGTKLSRTIAAIMEMEKTGAEVIYYSADVSKVIEMNRVLNDLREKYGKINGIIHCAGLAGDGLIINREEKVFKRVSDPKILGTWLLDKLTEQDNLDFFIMFSSVTSIFGGLGQGDYTAANSYMDSFTAYRNKKGKRTVTINWPAWKDIGMSVDYDVKESENTLKFIDTPTAIMVLNEIFERRIQRVVIGEVNDDFFADLKKQYVIGMDEDIKFKIKQKRLYNKKQPDDIMLKGGNDNEFTKTEINVARIWAEILGMAEVNIYDKLESLGGDSIIAIRLLKRLQSEYPGIVDISDVFTYSTVSSIAEYIDRASANKGICETKESYRIQKDMDELLEMLAMGEIAVADAEKFF